MSEQVKYTGTHAEVLGDGRPIAPGEVLEGIDLGDPHNAALRDAGLLLSYTETEEPQLEGDALQQEAKRLDIKNRTKMNADELRAAVTDAQEQEALASVSEETNDDNGKDGDN